MYLVVLYIILLIYLSRRFLSGSTCLQGSTFVLIEKFRECHLNLGGRFQWGHRIREMFFNIGSNHFLKFWVCHHCTHCFHVYIENRSIEFCIYITDMFVTGYDEANRETGASYNTDALPLVGLALRANRKIVDKITKGSKLHR